MNKQYAFTYLLYLRDFALGHILKFDPNWKKGERNWQNEWYWLAPNPTAIKLRAKGSKMYDEEMEKWHDTTYPDETPLMMMRIETDRRMSWFLKNMLKYKLIEPDGDSYKLTEYGKHIHETQGLKTNGT